MRYDRRGLLGGLISVEGSIAYRSGVTISVETGITGWSPGRTGHWAFVLPSGSDFQSRSQKIAIQCCRGSGPGEATLVGRLDVVARWRGGVVKRGSLSHLGCRRILDTVTSWNTDRWDRVALDVIKGEWSRLWVRLARWSRLWEVGKKIVVHGSGDGWCRRWSNWGTQRALALGQFGEVVGSCMLLERALPGI